MYKNDSSKQIIQNTDTDVKDKDSKKIKVQVHIPDHLHDRIRQQKINTIYDILKSNTA